MEDIMIKNLELIKEQTLKLAELREILEKNLLASDAKQLGQPISLYPVPNSCPSCELNCFATCVNNCSASCYYLCNEICTQTCRGLCSGVILN